MTANNLDENPRIQHIANTTKTNSDFEPAAFITPPGLTATVSRQDGNDYLLRQKAPIIDTVKLEEALSAGYVSPFRVLNVPVYLNDHDREEYQKLSKFGTKYHFYTVF